MKKPTRYYAEILFEAVKEVKTAAAEKIIKNFVALLGRQGMLKKIPQIITEFEKIYNRKHNLITVQVSTARTPTPATLKEITHWVKKHTDREVEVRILVQPKLLGGLEIRFEDKLLDASMAAQLRDLQVHLTK